MQASDSTNMKAEIGPFDTVSAFAAALGVLSPAGQSMPDRVLRAKLPTLADDATTATINLVAEVAAVSARAVNVVPNKLRADDCPVLVRGQAGGWHVIVDVAHAGLATELNENGIGRPVSLAALAGAKKLSGWALTPKATGTNASTVKKVNHKAPHKISFWPSGRILLPVILATLVINVLALAIPLATMNIYDRVISNAAFETLWMLALGVALALGFDFVLRILRTLVLDRASARSDLLAINEVFRRVLSARMSARRFSVGHQVNSLREFDTVRDYFNASAIAALGDFPFSALFLLVIWFVAGPLVVVPLIAMPLFFITAIAIQIRLRRLVENAFEDMANKSTVATELLSGLESIKLTGGEGWASFRWEHAVASQLKHSLAIRFWTNISLSLITLFQGAVTICVLVAGVYLVTAGTITPGALFAANLLAARCLAPMAAISALIARFTQIRMARDAVQDLAAMEDEAPADRKLLAPPSFEQSITFENVDHHYHPEGATALERARLVVKPGENIAIIGAIGSGKSTVLKLLSGLAQPSQGRILIDGLALSDIDPEAWRNQLGMVPQTPSFLSGTVRDAVAMGRRLDDSAIIKALTMSGALSWVSRTGLGLDTMLGEQGAGFSAGQLQTIAIARALVGTPKLLLLDEPTSHLDGRSEANFVKHLRLLPNDTTRLIVTHRPALIDEADRLIVVENGRIAFDGPRNDVMAQLRAVVAEQAKPVAKDAVA